jgi:hypothetical protein
MPSHQGSEFRRFLYVVGALTKDVAGFMKICYLLVRKHEFYMRIIVEKRATIKQLNASFVEKSLLVL